MKTFAVDYRIEDTAFIEATDKDHASEIVEEAITLDGYKNVDILNVKEI